MRKVMVVSRAAVRGKVSRVVDTKEWGTTEGKGNRRLEMNGGTNTNTNTDTNTDTDTRVDRHIRVDQGESKAGGMVVTAEIPAPPPSPPLSPPPSASQASPSPAPSASQASPSPSLPPPSPRA